MNVFPYPRFWAENGNIELGKRGYFLGYFVIRVLSSAPRIEARACFHYSQVLDRLEIPALAVYQAAAADDILSGPPCPTDYAADIASRAACQTGLFFEKAGNTALAEKLFRAGSSPECHERLVRLIYKNGDKAGAEVLIRQMIDDPASDDEFVFATDFYARKFGGRRTALCTELLRAGRRITVDDTHRGNPEAGVAGVMRRDGCTVFFAENTVWLNLSACFSGMNCSSPASCTAASTGFRIASKIAASFASSPTRSIPSSRR